MAAVVKLASPQELEVAFERAGCPLQLTKNEPPLAKEKLLSAVSLTLEYSVKTGSPLFFNQLYGRADENAICGEWVVAAANTNCHTFEVAPVFTMAERCVLQRFAAAIGKNFGACHDGLFVPGSSIGNMYALILARHRIAPEVHSKGMTAVGRLVAFVSEDAHYSYLKVRHAPRELSQAAHMLCFSLFSPVSVCTGAWHRLGQPHCSTDSRRHRSNGPCGTLRVHQDGGGARYHAFTHTFTRKCTGTH